MTVDTDAAATGHAPEAGQVDAFVSYSRADSTFATWLVGAAQARGRTFWLDAADIPPAAEWREELLQAIRSADAVLVVLTSSWLGSAECRRELELARRLGKRLVPVRLQSVTYDEIPLELRSLQWIDATVLGPDPVIDGVLAAIDADHERVRAHTRWLVEATRWDTTGRDRSHLPRGSELREAEAWLATAGEDPRPVPLQAEYVAAARRSERRRQRTTLGAVSVAAVIALVLAGLALWQRHVAIEQRNTAESRRLAAESQNELSVDPEIALILASDAWKAARTPQAATALRAASAASLVRDTVGTGADTVRAASLTRDGVLLTMADRRLQAWDDTGHATALRLGSDGLRLAADTSSTHGIVLTREGDAIGWSLSGHVLSRTRTADGAAAATVSRSGSTTAVAGKDGLVRTAGGDDGSWVDAIDVRGLDVTPRSVAVSDTGDTIAVGTGANSWTSTSTPVAGVTGGDVVVRTGTERPTVIADFDSPVETVQLSADGSHVLAVAASGDGRLLDVSDGTVVRSFSHAFTAAMDPAADTIAYGDIDGATSLLDVATGAVTEVAPADTPTTGVAFAPDGSAFVTSGPQSAARVWDSTDGSLLATLAGGRGASLTGAVFGADEQHLLTTYDDGTVRRWELPSPQRHLRIGLLPGASGTVEGSSVAPGPGAGRVTTVAGGLVQVWDLATGKEDCLGWPRTSSGACLMTSIIAQTLPVTALLGAVAAPAPDGRSMAVLGTNGGVWLFATVKAPDLLWHVDGDGSSGLLSAAGVLQWSPDGNLLVAKQSGGQPRVIDTASGRLVSTIRTGDADTWSVAWAGDSDELVTGDSTGALRIHTTDTGDSRPLSTLTGGSPALATAPDGSTVAVAPDQVVRLIDLADGSVVRELRGETSQIVALTYDTDGRFLAAVSADGMVVVWDAATGEAVESISTGSSPTAATFAGSDDLIATVGGDASGYLVPCDGCADPETLARRAPDRITLPLSSQDGTQFGLTSSQLGG